MKLGLPMNYVEFEQEEMMYLEGGWSSVRGLTAAFELTNMLSSVVSWGKLASILLAKCVAFSVGAMTVLGVAGAVLTSLGAHASLLAAVFNLGALTLGIYLLARDNGFQHKSWGIFGLSVSSVKSL